MFHYLADKFFFLLHLSLIFFNLFGWIPKKLRLWNLTSLLLTAFSWIVLGFFFGFGYCFLTDWHWDIRRELGHEPLSDSYIHFLITELTPLSPGEGFVDILTAAVFAVALTCSLWVNIKDRYCRRR